MLTGEKIKAARKERGLSQKEVAERAGMTAQQLGRYEKSKFIPRLQTLVRIAVAIGCTLYEITGDDSKYSTMEYLHYIKENPEGQIFYKHLKEIEQKEFESFSLPDDDYVEDHYYAADAQESKVLYLFRPLDDEDKEKAIDYLSLLGNQEKYNS